MFFVFLGDVNHVRKDLKVIVILSVSIVDSTCRLSSLGRGVAILDCGGLSSRVHLSNN